MCLPSPFPLHTLPTVPLLQIARLLDNSERMALSQCCRRLRNLIFESEDLTLDTRKKTICALIDAKDSIKYEDVRTSSETVAFSVKIRRRTDLCFGVKELSEHLTQILKCCDISAVSVFFDYLFAKYSAWDVFMASVARLGTMCIQFNVGVPGNDGADVKKCIPREEVVNQLAEAFLQFPLLHTYSFTREHGTRCPRPVLDRIQSICSERGFEFEREDVRYETNRVHKIANGDNTNKIRIICPLL